MESSHDGYRRRKRLAETGGNYRAWEGGKGDIDRSSHLDTYKLGAQLIKIAETLGKDSPEYKQMYEQWKAACAKAAGIKKND